jgi:hypothetical protein
LRRADRYRMLPVKIVLSAQDTRRRIVLDFRNMKFDTPRPFSWSSMPGNSAPPPILKRESRTAV